MSWTYPPEFLASLTDLGLAPTGATPPAVVRAALNDLYKFELRTMRDKLIAKEIEKAGYIDRVIVLRKKYWLLSLPLPAWERICGQTGSDATRR